MSSVWSALKKSLLCKPQPSDVVDPKLGGNLHTVDSSSSTAERCTCSNCLLKSKCVIWGSKRHTDNSAEVTPKCRAMRAQEDNAEGNQRPSIDSGAGDCDRTVVSGSFDFQIPAGILEKSDDCDHQGVSRKRDDDMCNFVGFTSLVCKTCGEQYEGLDAVEEHHKSKHSGQQVPQKPHVLLHDCALAELTKEDSARKIVEKICQTGCKDSETNAYKPMIERVLKVQNPQKVLDWLEEYREMVKTKASKEPDQHPRCMVDGNEVLRFYATTIACSPGMNGSSSPCTLVNCGACQILRDGFSATKNLHGRLGLFAFSTSQNALDYIGRYEQGQSLRKALFVCRVIAGRVHRPLENVQELTGSEFESLAWKLEPHWNVEELYVLNPRALLPCFMVIFQTLKIA